MARVKGRGGGGASYWKLVVCTATVIGCALAGYWKQARSGRRKMRGKMPSSRVSCASRPRSKTRLQRAPLITAGPGCLKAD